MKKRQSATALFSAHLNKTGVLCLILIGTISSGLATQNSVAQQTIQDKAIVILDEIVGLNVAEGNIKNISVRASTYRGLAQEEVDIRLSYGSRPLVTFANNTVRQIYLAESSGPYFGGPQAFLQRFQTYTGNPFYGELSSMLDNITGAENETKIVGNIELKVSNFDNVITDYTWTYIDENGIRASSKNIVLSYRNGGLQGFLNNWPFYTIAAEPQISGEEAIAIALKELRSFSYEGVSKFRIATNALSDPVSVFISYSNNHDPRLARDGDPLRLYPFWSVFMGFDGFYGPYYITGASAGGWADTGAVESIGPATLYYPGVTTKEIIDDTPPSITVSLLESKANYSDISLSYEASEPLSWVDYSLDGKKNVTITGNTTVTGNFTLTGLSEGLHNVTVYAADAYGSTANIGVSNTIDFTIAKTEPFPTAIVPAVCGVSAAVIGIGMFVYFNKRGRSRET